MSIESVHRYSNLLDDGWSRQNLRSQVYREDVAHPSRGVYGPPGTFFEDNNAMALAKAKSDYAAANAAAMIDPVKANAWPVQSATFQQSVFDGFNLEHFAGLLRQRHAQ